MILAEVSGNVTGRFIGKGNRVIDKRKSFEVCGILCLFIGLFLLSISWDRIDCFPLSNLSNCVRVLPLLLPFLAGFLGCYEKGSLNWGSIRQLGRKQVRLVSLTYTTVMLFVPAVISWVLIEHDGGDSVSVSSLCWPLVNTVVFGVLLNESYGDEKLVNAVDFRREFVVTFVCTIVLELFYYPEISLWGLLLCGLLMYVAVRELDPVNGDYELGIESSESLTSLVMKPINHILSERKSRKIALFLLINTAYMVVEFVAGFMSNSLGLISDACHMLFDCAALGIGLYASYISRLPANGQFNYGRGRFEVLSGYVNAVFLVLVGALIVLESLERILDPQEISTNSLLTVSIGGLLVNVIGLVFFHEEHHHAHGGSCSHSHSHSHSHHSHSHDHGSQGKSCSAHCNDHDHHGHSHGHEHHSHDHHGHTKGHDHRSHTQGHDHHHGHSHDHEQHSHDHHEHMQGHDQNHGHTQGHDDHHKHTQGHDHHHEHTQGHDHHHGDQQGHIHEHNQQGQTHHHDDHCDHHDHDNHGLLNKPCNSTGGRGKEEAQKQHKHIDHNMEGIFLHVLADTMGSVGVVISTLLIKYKGWLIADPACSIFISIMIVSSVIPLLRNSAEILLQRVPRAHEVELREALNDVMNLKGVRGFQNLHIWSFTNTDIVGTLRLLVSTEVDKTSVKAQVSHILHDAGIKDLTLQAETVK